MIITLRQFTIPAFIVLCIVLGGSAQAVWGSLALQVIAILIIGSALVWPVESSGSSGRGLLLLLLAALFLLGLQLVPLPPRLWTSLPGRDVVEQGYVTLGQELPWLPASLTPYATLESLLFLLVPTAVILAVLRLDAFRESWVAATLFAGTVAAILLSYIQVTAGEAGRSIWYLYDVTNFGSAVGFFANRNHMGTLLLVTLPFLVALFFGSSDVDPRRLSSLRIIGVAGLLVIFLGIALNGSLAALALAVPVLFASALLVPALRRFRAILASAAAVALIGALVFLANSPVQSKLTGETTSSFEGRWQIWNRTIAAIAETFPVGTGIGSFERIYVLQEPPQELTNTYVNHAHNDYLELVLETGLAGIILVTAFLAWWIRCAVRALASPLVSRYAVAAVIASGAVLAHSVVDYPLRTGAIAAVFAFCVALMSARRRIDDQRAVAGPRRARHIVIG